MRSAGRGGSEEEVEDVHEDGDEEEVVDFGNVGCAAMLAGAALRAAAASAAGTVGRLEGPGRDQGARRADRVRSGGRGRRQATVSAFSVWLGWAPTMREGVQVAVRGELAVRCCPHRVFRIFCEVSV